MLDIYNEIIKAGDVIDSISPVTNSPRFVLITYILFVVLTITGNTGHTRYRDDAEART